MTEAVLKPAGLKLAFSAELASRGKLLVSIVAA